MKYRYIASCVFTRDYPELSLRIQDYQDCWRQYDNQAEQAAVRELLRRMNIEVVEKAETLTIFLFLLATVLFRYI